MSGRSRGWLGKSGRGDIARALDVVGEAHAVGVSASGRARRGVVERMRREEAEIARRVVSVVLRGGVRS